MAIFSLIDLDSAKLEPLIIATLGAGALVLLYFHVKNSQANAQADAAGAASSDYLNQIVTLDEYQALTGQGQSTTGASEQPTYSAPSSATVSPTLNGGVTPSGTGAPSITFEIPGLPFSTVSTNFGTGSTGSGAG